MHAQVYTARFSSSLFRITGLCALVGALVLSGCSAGLASVQLPERRLTTFDFRPFLEKGFLFAATLEAGSYETLGLITLSFRPGPGELVRRPSELRASGWTEGGARVTPLLEKMAESAQALGGDGVLNLSVAVETDNAGTPTYRLTGFAIKRR